MRNEGIPQEPDREKAFEVALQTRNFEIELFWKRSLFFWGFIGSAFVGYAALRANDRDLAVVVACFGMVCSFAWALVNRGSKYWQENWEQKVRKLAPEIVDKLFSELEPIQAHKGRWLRARMFSVSKLAIALSDYAFLFWFLLILSDLSRKYIPDYADKLARHGPAIFVFLSILYVGLLAWHGRISTRQDK